MLVTSLKLSISVFIDFFIIFKNNQVFQIHNIRSPTFLNEPAKNM